MLKFLIKLKKKSNRLSTQLYKIKFLKLVNLTFYSITYKLSNLLKKLII